MNKINSVYLQPSFAKLVGDIEDEKESEMGSEMAMRFELFKSLMQRASKGELVE